MKILVTGATGFIGSHLCKHLSDEGFTVLGAKRASSNTTWFQQLNGPQLERFSWVDVDLSDTHSILDHLEDIDAVYHCAGKVSFEKRDIQSLDESNRKATRHVVHACLHLGIPMCHFSSTSVFIHSEKRHHDWPLENPDGERSSYGMSKYLAELEVWRGREEGLDAVIINPGIVLGYGDWNSGSSALFRNAYKEFRFYTDGSTGFVGVDDVCKAAMELMKQRYFKERFLLVEDNYGFRDIQTMISEFFNKRPPSVRVGKSISLAIATLTAPLSWFGLKPLITKETALSANRKSTFEGRRIETVLQSFRYTPIREVIQQACSKYRS